MNSESLEFLQTLFARVSVGAIALTGLPCEGRGAITCHVPLAMYALRSQAVARLQERNRQGSVNALVGIATRRMGLTAYQRGGKANLLELPALFIDIDQPPAEVYRRLARFSPPPSLIVASGLGTHLYWLLAEPTTDFREGDALLIGLAQALGGDRLTVAQSMRLPGTANLKAGRGACYILENQPQRLYTLVDFAAYRPPCPKPRGMRRSTGAYLDDLAQAISGVLIADYGGYLKANGWLAARCPADHVIDYPGKHFFFNKVLHIGHCFGRHGLFLLNDLKALLERP